MPGTPMDDTLYGSDGADVIHGLAGNDTIYGVDGEDQLYGDEGNDTITIGGNGMRFGQYAAVFTATMLGDGGIGNDTLIVQTNASNVTAIGGDGDDIVRMQSIGGLTVNAGIGNDLIDVQATGTTVLTLGAGADTVQMGVNTIFAAGSSITITDFVAGEDRFSLNLNGWLSGWTGSTNPFTSGYLRLVQSGADTLLQMDRDASGASYSFTTLARLQNVQASAITDVDGYPVAGGGRFIYGTPGNDTLLYGTGNPDTIYGLGGNDSINGAGDADVIHGDDGNDYLSGGGGGSDALYGDAGNDTLVIGLDSYRYLDQLILDGGIDDDYLYFGNSPVTNSGDIANGHASGPSATIIGGTGNDLMVLMGSGAATVNAGAGNDSLLMGGMSYYAGVVPAAYTITLGTGADTVSLARLAPVPGVGPQAVHVITDFNPTEDRIAFDQASMFMTRSGPFVSIDVANAFAQGFLRLVASGSDTIVQLDNDGGGNQWADLLLLQNVAPAAITEIAGYRVNGTGTVDMTIGATSSYGFNPGTAPMRVPLRGGGGNDTVTGSIYNDALSGEGGNDTLRGLGGDDTIYTGFGDNFVEGGEGNDNIYGQGSHDLLYGGDGNDIMTYSPVTPYGATSDTVTMDGGIGDDTLSAYSTNASVTFIGGDGNDIITSDGFGTNVVNAGVGADRITMSNYRTTMTLGAGADIVTMRFYIRTTPLDQLATITDWQGGVDSLVFDRAEMLFGWTSGNPFAQGYLWLAQDGADVVLRRDFDGGGDRYFDFVRFQNISVLAFTAADFAGSDPSVAPMITPIQGAAGNDSLQGSTSPNIMSGLDGDDTLDGGQGNDVLIGGMGADALIGGEGIDWASYEDNYGFVSLSLLTGLGYTNAAAGDTYSGIENVRGSVFGDYLIGSYGVNTLEGGAGDDVLIGSLGGDVLVGGEGSDWASYEDNQGAVFIDLLRGSGYANGAQGDTYTGIENLRGTIFNDYLIGSNGVNALEGGNGNDILIGGLGADALNGGLGVDTVSYEDNQGAVFVNLTSGQGQGNAAHGDTYSGIENISGTVFYDTLVGDNNANTIDGGRGNDLLIGEGGADIFLFTTIFEATNVDTVADFVQGADRIGLGAAMFGYAAGALSAAQLANGTPTTASQHIVYNPVTGALSYDSDGSGAAASIVFAQLQTGLTMTAADFVVM